MQAVRSTQMALPGQMNARSRRTSVASDRTASRLWDGGRVASEIRHLGWRSFWQKSGDVLAVVDAGALYASVDRYDETHERCVAVLTRRDLDLVIPAMVVAEVIYFIGTRLGFGHEAAFLRGLREVSVRAPEPDDWLRIGELVEQYGDFPLGGTDASVIVLAERLGTELVVTLDHRHFSAIRPRHCRAFQLLPDW